MFFLDLLPQELESLVLLIRRSGLSRASHHFHRVLDRVLPFLRNRLTQQIHCLRLEFRAGGLGLKLPSRHPSQTDHQTNLGNLHACYLAKECA